MFEYRAIVTKVYDGDTITVDIDFNDDMFSRKVIRIMRTDTGRRIIEEIAGN